MKRFLLATVFFYAFLLTPIWAQESVYLANGNSSIGKIIGASDDKVRIAVVRGDKTVEYSLRRENVLLAFNDAGHYLIISDLAPDASKAMAQITAFNKAPARKIPYDIIIKTAPVKAIPGIISYESEDVINYQLPTGSAASISKREISAVLYRNGRHTLLTKSAAVATVLKSAQPQLQTLSVMKPQVAARAKTPPAGKGKPVPKEAPVPTSAPPERVAAKKPTLTPEEYQMYRTKSLQTVDEFVGYLNKIANEEAEEGEKETAIKEALKLFLPDAVIEVTSLKNPGVRRIKLKEYLTRLKMNVYGRVTIEWNEIQYISELKKAADGNYYGVISGQQTFIGYSANGKDVLYTDVTEKNVNVKLESYKKTIEGKDEDGWKVLLGNIGVSGSN